MARARATATRCRWPPDRAWMRRVRKLSQAKRPTSSSARSAAPSRRQPDRRMGSSTAARTVMRGLRAAWLSWSTICTPPRRRWRAAKSAASPWNSTAPSPSRGSSPARVRARVVLPAPERPTRETISPL